MIKNTTTKLLLSCSLLIGSVCAASYSTDPAAINTLCHNISKIELHAAKDALANAAQKEISKIDKILEASKTLSELGVISNVNEDEFLCNKSHLIHYPLIISLQFNNPELIFMILQHHISGNTSQVKYDDVLMQEMKGHSEKKENIADCLKTLNELNLLDANQTNSLYEYVDAFYATTQMVTDILLTIQNRDNQDVPTAGSNPPPAQTLPLNVSALYRCILADLQMRDAERLVTERQRIETWGNTTGLIVLPQPLPPRRLEPLPQPLPPLPRRLEPLPQPLPPLSSRQYTQPVPQPVPMPRPMPRR